MYQKNPLLEGKIPYRATKTIIKRINSVKDELSRFRKDEDGILRMWKNGKWNYDVEGYFAELKGTLGELRSMLNEISKKPVITSNEKYFW